MIRRQEVRLLLLQKLQHFTRYPGLVWVWLLGVVFSSSYGINQAALDLSLGKILLLSLTALGFSAIVSRANIPKFWAVLSIISLGLEYILFIWGGLWWSIWLVLKSEGLVLQAIFRRLLLDFSTLSGQLIVWLGQITDAPNSNPMMLTLLWGFFIWLSVAYLGWATWQHPQVISSALPLAILLAITLFFAQGPYIMLGIFLVCLPGLQMSLNHVSRLQRWQNEQIDYPDDLGVDLNIATLPIIISIAGLALLLPTIRIAAITNAIVNTLNLDVKAVNRFAESFGLEATQRVTGYGPNKARLPRSHLLQGEQDLGNKWIMRIQTGDYPPMSPAEAKSIDPVPNYYWQAQVYDEYRGSGWQSSHGKRQRYEAEVPLQTLPNTPGRQIQQIVQRSPHASTLLYSSGSPLWLTQTSEVNYLSNGDIAAVSLMHQNYQATSWLVEATSEQLRQAGTDYPSAIRQSYLNLPDSIPERVHTLAQDITAQAVTPYDKTVALEAYLRGFFYNLSVEKAPSNHDVVDYFLFELQEGYCDYYASSMVVMARSVGLPARFVVGYTSGTYNPQEAVYEVTEAEAHSWAQIYFPEIGWVNFEPTAGRPAISRSENNPNQTSNTINTAPDFVNQPVHQANINASWHITSWIWRSGQALGLSLLGLGGMLFAGLAYDAWRLRQLSALELSETLYQRLRLWAKRNHYQTTGSQTPFEFERNFRRYLQDQAPFVSLSLLEKLTQVIELVIRQRYTQPHHRPASESELIKHWQGLQLALIGLSIRLRMIKFYSGLFNKATPPSNPTSSPKDTGTIGQSSQ